MISLTRNCTAPYRDLGKILKECKETLPPEILSQIKRVLHHCNPTKFIVRITEEQHREARFSKNTTKVETIISKEERKKCVATFPCWIEKFFPDLWPQGFIFKEGKKYRLAFDGSFLETLLSTYMGKLVSTTDEIELYFRSVISSHLAQIFNIRISYPEKEILIFDDDASGAFSN